ncbi:MAG: carbohydrate ABC transporter permease [Defluviitaleaceae bacterium]|nr:carbohydrate ABC transporter permease [Defluviitaleaceae bacterium]MCL2836242.1 carbohydrate ABC transporter permease [Defluviitaleaceae bacterium]
MSDAKLKTALRRTAKAGLYIFLLIWAFIQIFPLYWMFSFSLKSNQEIFVDNPIGLPRDWLWENYRDVIQNANMLRYLANSLIVSAVTITIVTICGLMATYAITRMVWRGRGVMRSYFMLGLALPIHAALLPIFLVLRNMRMLNSHWALILPYSGFALSMSILIFIGFINGIPNELEESACLDGCSVYGIFIRIIMPLMAPAISVVSIFTFLQCWNELLFASVYITDGRFRTLTVGIMSMTGQYRTNWGPIGAGLTVATIPTLAIYFALSKKVQSSLVLGALKG